MKPSSFLCVLFALTATAVPMPDPIPSADYHSFDKMGKLSAELAKRKDSASLDKRQFNFDITRNELGECKPVTVIFARGTIELGNVGSITGPPFFNALDVVLGAENVAVQGVDYPASILGYLEGGDKGGAATAAALLNQAASQCPDTQIVLSGYSQGAQVVHLGEAQVSPEVAARIAAIVSLSCRMSVRHELICPKVVFGDPDKGQPFANVDSSKVQTYCFFADLICDMLPVVDTYHLSYSVDAVPAAEFVAGLVNV